MTTLVIAEKPDVGRNIANVIAGAKQKKGEGYIDCGEYLITWAVGHLLGLAEADEYDPKYKRWVLNDLPIIPEKFKLTPNPKTKAQLTVIKGLAKRCDAVINACDSGREGELIFGYIMEYLNVKLPVKRLWISDLTPATIREGFRTLKDGKEYTNLLKAAKGRSISDWVIGINGTRSFSTKFGRPGNPLSVGRVQTPVLAMIYDRQISIENFKPEKYFEVEGHFKQGEQSYKGLWQGPEERFTDEKKAKEVAEKVKGKKGKITKYEIKETNESPYLLYDLTSLQSEANAKFGFPAKKTLDVAQKLYESHKVITYPRTDSKYVGEANIPVMHNVLEHLKETKYGTWAKKGDKSLVHIKNRNVCNPSKVSDHHAILPTNQMAKSLTPDEEKIYDLIVKRFLSHFFPDAKYKNYSILTEVEGETFKTNVREVLHLGWREIYASDKKEEGEENDEVMSFSLDPKKEVDCLKADLKKKETRPPHHYTEGTLLRAMETAGKEIEDEELRQAMKGSGLGTPATRAATIERLKNAQYIELERKKIVITQKGRSIIEIVRSTGAAEILTSAEMTAKWEKELDDISKGMGSSIDFWNNIKKFAVSIVDEVRKHDKVIEVKTEDGETKSVSVDKSSFDAKMGGCPSCGKGKIVKKGVKAYGCSDWKEGCSFTIWSTQFGKKLTDKNIQDLIEKKITSAIQFTSKNGKPYKAKLRLEDVKTGKLALEFVNEPKKEKAK